MKHCTQVHLLHIFLPLPNGNTTKHIPTHGVLDLESQEKFVLFRGDFQFIQFI